MADYGVLLVCAGYFVKAGYRVALLERRHEVGGPVVTEEIVPGFHFDLGGSAHILINRTPIVRDLDLTAYGLDYLLGQRSGGDTYLVVAARTGNRSRHRLRSIGGVLFLSITTSFDWIIAVDSRALCATQ